MIAGGTADTPCTTPGVAYPCAGPSHRPAAGDHLSPTIGCQRAESRISPCGAKTKRPAWLEAQAGRIASRPAAVGGAMCARRPARLLCVHSLRSSHRFESSSRRRGRWQPGPADHLGLPGTRPHPGRLRGASCQPLPCEELLNAVGSCMPLNAPCQGGPLLQSECKIPKTQIAPPMSGTST